MAALTAIAISFNFEALRQGRRPYQGIEPCTHRFLMGCRPISDLGPVTTFRFTGGTVRTDNGLESHYDQHWS